MFKNENVVVPEILPAYEDGIFKALLTHQEARPVLRDVVESYLQLKISKVDVRNVELPVSNINEKRERFDVNCLLLDGTQADIEMQADPMSGDSEINSHKVVKGRAIYHLCDLHSSQDGRSVRYDKLMRSFQLTLCGYNVFPDADKFIYRFSMRDEGGMELSDAVGIIFIDLTKLGDIVKKPVEGMTGDEIWSIFFTHAAEAKHAELIKRLSHVKREVKLASDLLRDISKDENERSRFRSRRMFELDMEHTRHVTRDDRSLEIAKKLIEMGMPVDNIVLATGLKREELDALHGAQQKTDKTAHKPAG